MKYYKLVRVLNNGTYQSAFNGDLPYSLTDWTFPQIPKSKLFVFDSEDSARDFVEENIFYFNEFKLFECAVGDVKPTTIKGRSYQIEEFWTDSIFYSSPAPKGTNLTDKVMLTKEIPLVVDNTTYYKLVRKDYYLGQLTSSFADTVYTPNEWVSPPIPNSKLFVFDSISNATRHISNLFGRQYQNYKLFECQVSKAQPAQRMCYLLSKAKDFWNNPGSLDEDDLDDSPQGTYFVDAVKITKEVHFSL